MDIELLSRMVGDLILDSDEVRVNGLGTFKAELQPSVFSDKGYTLNPPYRRLVFSPEAGTDTLLEEAYAKANGLGREQAAAVIETLGRSILSDLKTSGSVEFEGLGVLKQTSSGSPFFVCDPDLDIFPEGYALKPVSLRTHAAATPGREQKASSAESSDTSDVQQKPRRKCVAGRIALALLTVSMALLLAYLLLARFEPEFIDRLLYTEEEYNLIHNLH